jgi:hypothetical protein
MRKNRNSFFTESNMSYQGYNPGVNMMPNAPYQAGTSYNSFYTGPNMNGANMNTATSSSDIDNRFAKIERQISRLEHRVSKLETTSNNTYIDDVDNSGNMYML